jgi:hypothetical protein
MASQHMHHDNDRGRSHVSAARYETVFAQVSKHGSQMPGKLTSEDFDTPTFRFLTGSHSPHHRELIEFILVRVCSRGQDSHIQVVIQHTCDLCPLSYVFET